jgi:hypothetical protein
MYRFRYDDGRSKGIRKTRTSHLLFMRYLAAVLLNLLLADSVWSVELFRYRGAAKDGGTLEYIFDTDEQDAPKTVPKRKWLKSQRIS